MSASPSSYRERVLADWGGLGIWDYLRYDEAGDLWVNDLRVADAIRAYGSPLEIVDTTLVERRAREWVALSRSVAESLAYPGHLRYLYAAKANMASEMTHAAYRSGWGAETSAAQDLAHLEWMRERGLVGPDLRVVCNGFKLPTPRYGPPRCEPSISGDPAPSLDSGTFPGPGGRVELPLWDGHGRVREAPYAERILALAGAGWDITPILDEGELASFADPSLPPLKVGLRLKCGQARDLGELDALVSRFGFDRARLAAEAEAIARLPHLRLTTLHAMVGAAETIPVDRFVAGVLAGARVWAELRRVHSSLTELNMGGGIPPLGEAYDHRGFLRALFGGLLAVAAEAGLPPPDLTFELGSLVAAEAGFHVFKVLQLKRNHRAAAGEIQAWAILDGGLMAAIPDMLLIGKAFRCLAVSGADRPARRVRLGDTTCDSDGRYPPAAFGPDEGVWLPESGEGPDAPEDLYLLIQGVGAYQEILAGVRGAHHCGLLEAVELILERGADGRLRGRLMPRQTAPEAAKVLGYTEGAAEAMGRLSADGSSPPGADRGLHSSS